MDNETDPGGTALLAMPELSTVTLGTKDGVRVIVSGEVDTSNAWELREALQHAAEHAAGGVEEVDMCGVTFMDSSGLQALLEARAAAAGKLVIVESSLPVRRLLAATALVPQTR